MSKLENASLQFLDAWLRQNEDLASAGAYLNYSKHRVSRWRRVGLFRRVKVWEKTFEIRVTEINKPGDRA